MMKTYRTHDLNDTTHPNTPLSASSFTVTCAGKKLNVVPESFQAEACSPSEVHAELKNPLEISQDS